MNKKTGSWEHQNAHEEGCASLTCDQPVRPCDATCEVLMLSVMQGKDKDPVGRFVQRGCLPTQMDSQTEAFEADDRNKKKFFF